MAAARNPRRAKPENEGRMCGDCGWGEPYYDHGNLDVWGKPICVRCPYSKWDRIRSNKACKEWKGK